MSSNIFGKIQKFGMTVYLKTWWYKREALEQLQLEILNHDEVYKLLESAKIKRLERDLAQCKEKLKFKDNPEAIIVSLKDELTRKIESVERDYCREMDSYRKNIDALILDNNNLREFIINKGLIYREKDQE